MNTAHILTPLPLVDFSLFAKPSWEEKSLEQVLSYIRTLKIEIVEDLVVKAEGGDWAVEFGLPPTQIEKEQRFYQSGLRKKVTTR